MEMSKLSLKLQFTWRARYSAKFQGVNALHPKLKFASVVGSYGWNARAIERPAELLPHLKVEALPVVLCKGLPREANFKAVDDLAAAIANAHKEANLV